MTFLAPSRRGVLLGAAAAVSSLAAPGLMRNAWAADTELNILSYPGFVPNTFRAKFESETGIKLNIKETDQAHTVFNTLVADAGKPSADLIVSVGHLLPRFMPSSLIKPIETSRLSNWGRIETAYSESEWLNLNGQTWALPLLVGFQTLAWNKELEPAPLDSWSAIFDEKYAGKISWRLSDFLDFALIYLGHDHNLVDYIGDDARARQVVAEATDFVIQKKPLVRKFYDSTAELEQLFVNEDIIVSHARNGLIGNLLQNDFPIAYEIPKEGAASFVYNWSIANGTTREDTAYRFLDAYLSDETIGADVQLASGYLSTFKGADKGIEGKVVTLDEEQLKRIKFLRIENNELKDQLYLEAEAKIGAA